MGENTHVQAIYPRGLQADSGSNIADGKHVGRGRGTDQPRGFKEIVVLVLHSQHPVLLAGSIEIVTTGRQRSLDGSLTKARERTHRVTDHLPACKQLRQRWHRVLYFGYLVIGIFNTRDDL